MREQEEEEEEIVEVKVEASESEEGFGREVAMEARENGLDECASGPWSAHPKARELLGLSLVEDQAQDVQSQPQASQDQDSLALTPQV